MKAKILVIDDEESIRFTFNEFLAEEGHTVFLAATYGEAVRIIDKKDIDLIFADIIIGRHNGIEILKKINKENLLCPVIMITGQSRFSLFVFLRISIPLCRPIMISANIRSRSFLSMILTASS
jgi:DNA-binding NtrC family response regulator